MSVEIRWASWIVIVAAETQVALPINVDLQRVPAGDDDPHANVKLSIHDQHRVLNVFLNYPRLFRESSISSLLALNSSVVILLL